ncbi:MAG: hypothetical protein UEP31_05660 [Anaerovoracaceae bacterium]|nr:hypothetical protein [Anaerovoracaceae bacterium]
MKEYKSTRNAIFKKISTYLIVLMISILGLSTVAYAGTITASDHWVLEPQYNSIQHMWYAGATGYTTSTSYHRTTIKYYFKWDQLITEKKKWGTGKVTATTGYLERYQCNVKNGFHSDVYYYFSD